MIIGNINHLELVPFLPKKLKEAIEYVKTNINSNTPVGRYDIDGNNSFVLVQEPTTRDINSALPEFHNKYLDIQILLTGLEGMAVSKRPPHTEIVEDKLAEGDIAFNQTAEDETVFTLFPDDFVIFYPNEVHKPLCAINNKITGIRKIVVKVAAASL